MAAWLKAVSLDRQFEAVHCCDADLIAIGRDASCQFRIQRPTISKHHAVIQRENGRYMIKDLGSTQGLLINGKKQFSHALSPGDKILVGDVALIFLDHNPNSDSALIGEGVNEAAMNPHGETIGIPTQELERRRMRIPTTDFSKEEGRPPTQSIEMADFQEDAMPAFAVQKSGKGKRNKKVDEYTALRSTVHEELIKRMQRWRYAQDSLDDEELYEQSRRFADEIIYEMSQAGKIPTSVSLKKLLKDVLDEAHGLGPIQDFLGDATIEEIMVNGAESIYIARRGKGPEPVDRQFTDQEKLLTVINRILAPIGRVINQSRPMVDGRLPDGSRINAVIPPVSLIGPVLTIRKFPEKPLKSSDIVSFGSCSKAMMKFFQLAVENHQNILLAGGTGTGKTTMLNVISSFIPREERIVTIEDSAELKLQQPHVVSMETRPASLEEGGVEEVSIRHLVKNALRMRPDRIIVGECRGAEAIDMLQAMNTGHDGSMTTGHANSTQDMLSRLETMVLMAGLKLDLRAIRDQVARAIDIIIYIERFRDGKRRVVQVSELAGIDEGEYVVNDIYRFHYTINENNEVEGRFIPAGPIPRFIEEINERGGKIGYDIFEEG